MSATPDIQAMSDEGIHEKLDLIAAEIESLRPGRAGALPLAYKADVLDLIAGLESMAAAALEFKLQEARQEVAKRPLSLADLVGVSDLLAAPAYCERLRAVVEAPAADGMFDLVSDRSKEDDAARRVELEQVAEALTRELSRRSLVRQREAVSAELAELEEVKA